MAVCLVSHDNIDKGPPKGLSFPKQRWYLHSCLFPMNSGECIVAVDIWLVAREIKESDCSQQRRPYFQSVFWYWSPIIVMWSWQCDIKNSYGHKMHHRANRWDLILYYCMYFISGDQGIPKIRKTKEPFLPSCYNNNISPSLNKILTTNSSFVGSRSSNHRSMM